MKATVDHTSGGYQFIDPNKRNTVANVAIARELAGRCWSLATLDDGRGPHELLRRTPHRWQRAERPAPEL